MSSVWSGNDSEEMTTVVDDGLMMTICIIFIFVHRSDVKHLKL